MTITLGPLGMEAQPTSSNSADTPAHFEKTDFVFMLKLRFLLRIGRLTAVPIAASRRGTS
jgi:hypothetical protein